ncbi:hypothetical protein ESCO_000164 [Escovopsis weberi]|uniref:DUF5672 domain-containing protein n=1 Tax=Escovopsis weberi TaxID=150374 RepID=A0A0M8MVB9_ESCWE|nr:hypothetical protein ESCO_000164 [Escovopsis weberi]
MKRLRPSGVLAVSLTRVLLLLLLLLLLILCWSFGHVLPVPWAKEALRHVMPGVNLKWDEEAPAEPLAFNGSKLALLIEPRPLPHLATLILHMIAVVPPDWRFLFVGTRESVFAVGRPQAVRRQRAVGKLGLLELGAPWAIETKEHVFRLLTDGRFYDEFLPGVEWILKYEADSLLCANSEVSLDEWLGWDWAGALRSGDDRFSGHGGLSLRRVSVIKRVLGFQSRANNTEPEDVWFGKRVAALPGARVASRLDGVLSVEDVYAERPMGFHVRGGGAALGGELWADAGRRRAMLEYCPELSIVMDMKLERERCPDDDGDGHRPPGAGVLDADWDGDLGGGVEEVNPDVAVRFGIVGLDEQWEGVGAEGADMDGTDAAVKPPQPPPLPRPWKDPISGQDLHLPGPSGACLADGRMHDICGALQQGGPACMMRMRDADACVDWEQDSVWARWLLCMDKTVNESYHLSFNLLVDAGRVFDI